jgi:glycosyltransferase involved in cell wall biosynthesis
VKILHVYKDYHPVVGGIENHLRLLAEGQAEAGHDVTVLVTNRAPNTTAELHGGVRVIKAARLAHLASTPISASLFREIARLRPDITHLHFPYPVGEVAQHLLGRSAHTVLTYHCDIVRQRLLLALYRPLLRRILGRVERIVVSSPALLSSPLLRRHETRCRVVPHGIVRAPFLEPRREESRAIRERYGGGPTLLFVGVLRHYKGIEYLLEAMRELPGRLLVVGDGPMAGRLHARAEALGVERRVVFLGAVADRDLPAYYQAADLLVLPASTRGEAFGLVQLEAMSSGLPVVCTELGTGTSYVNRHGCSGLVVPPRSVQGLVDAIGRLLADEALRRRLAEGARERSRRFSAERMVRRTLDVYQEIAASPG